MKRVLIATMSLGLLTGCAQLNTITLASSRLLGNVATGSQLSFWCSASIGTAGLGPSYYAAPDDTLVGYQDIFDGGSGPFPCVERVDHYYRGGAAFDLSQFDDITSATLNFDVRRSITANGEVVGNFDCNATTLGMATGNDSYAFDHPVSLPPCGPSYSINVSSQARQWSDHSHDNFGFILAGPKLDFPNDLPNDNSVRITWYTNFRLVILYDPAQNPRAPQ